MDNRLRAMRACFAIVKTLLVGTGISNDDFWEYIKAHFKVESRKELGEKEWVYIEARLRSCEMHPQIKAEMISRCNSYICKKNKF